MALLVEHGRAEAVEPEAPAAVPHGGLGNAALFTVNDFLQARDAMRHGVLTHFNADIAAPHLVRHGRSRAGAEKGVEDEVAGVGGDLKHVFDKIFWLWSDESDALSKQMVYLGFCGPVTTCHTMRKDCFRWPPPIIISKYPVVRCPARTSFHPFNARQVFSDFCLAPNAIDPPIRQIF